MKRISIYILLCFSFVIRAQVNLVPNPSFEVHSFCPQDAGTLEYATGWFNPNVATPDLFDTCFNFSTAWSEFMDVPQNYAGNQTPIHGSSYAGLIAYYDSLFVYREYLEAKLISSLMANQKYFISFYVNLSDSSQQSVDMFGCYFSNDSVESQDALPLSYIPQVNNLTFSYLADKQNWMKISGTYIAQGNENFLTIGNFSDSINSHTINVPNGSTNVAWKCAYYYVDFVCVSTDSLTCNTLTSTSETTKPVFSVFPNPATELLKITSEIPGKIKLTNLLGEVLYNQPISIGEDTICVFEFPPDLYFLEFENINGQSIIYKLVIQH
jgi:hypothetical protein